ncbi:MAG: DUF4326 domain-containing protein [Paludibacter sp.]|nr:DUF4326 domain-containing protein [Paludibacter sp.]
MKIEKYTEDLTKYINLVHEAIEGRYTLTGYDQSVIEAALIQLQGEERPLDDKLKSFDNGLAKVFMRIATYMPIHAALQLDDLREIMIQDLRKMIESYKTNNPMPKRIQRKRIKDWRKPKNCIDVTRGTKWGNIFVVGKRFDDADLLYAIDYVHSLNERDILRKTKGIVIRDAEMAVELYKKYIDWKIKAYPDRYDLSELRGHDLMCWCGPDEICHADYLIQISNK